MVIDMSIDFHYWGKKKCKAIRHQIFKGICYLDGNPCRHNYQCETPDNEIDFTQCPGSRKVLEALNGSDREDK